MNLSSRLGTLLGLIKFPSTEGGISMCNKGHSSPSSRTGMRTACVFRCSVLSFDSQQIFLESWPFSQLSQGRTVTGRVPGGRTGRTSQPGHGRAPGGWRLLLVCSLSSLGLPRPCSNTVSSRKRPPVLCRCLQSATQSRLYAMEGLGDQFLIRSLGDLAWSSTQVAVST